MLSKADGVWISLKIQLTYFLNSKSKVGCLVLKVKTLYWAIPSTSPHKSLGQYHSCLWQLIFQGKGNWGGMWEKESGRGKGWRKLGKTKSKINKCNWYTQLSHVANQSLVWCPFSSHLHWYRSQVDSNYILEGMCQDSGWVRPTWPSG